MNLTFIYNFFPNDFIPKDMNCTSDTKSLINWWKSKFRKTNDLLSICASITSTQDHPKFINLFVLICFYFLLLFIDCFFLHIELSVYLRRLNGSPTSISVSVAHYIYKISAQKWFYSLCKQQPYIKKIKKITVENASSENRIILEMYTSYAVTAGMQLHTNAKLTIEQRK